MFLNDLADKLKVLHCFTCPFAKTYFIGVLNPAVSVGLLAGGEFSILKTGLYILAQCAGATLGSGVLFAITPESRRSSLASTSLGEDVHPVSGLVLEAVLTMMLVLVVYSTAVDTNTKSVPGLAPIAIGEIL